MPDKPPTAPPEAPGGEISIDVDGRFRHEGVVITHQRTIEAFFAGLEADGAGGYRLSIGFESAPVRVEDTPLIVNSVDEADGELVVVLSDGTREPLDPNTLRVREDNAFVCLARADFPARFSRQAHYLLADFIEEAEGGYELVVGAARFPIASSLRDSGL